MRVLLAAAQVYLTTGTSIFQNVFWFSITLVCRLYVVSLTSGCSDASFQGYKTEASAQSYYTANRHLMEVRRDSRSDEEKFGPLSFAYDVNWRGF